MNIVNKIEGWCKKCWNNIPKIFVKAEETAKPKLIQLEDTPKEDTPKTFVKFETTEPQLTHWG